MKSIARLLTIAATLSACSHTPPARPDFPRTTYACDNGEQVEMRFFPAQGVGVLVRAGKTVELQQQPVASGFLYSNGPTSVRGKDREISVEIGRMMPIRCQAL